MSAGSSCTSPMGVVAAIVESSVPHIVERMAGRRPAVVFSSGPADRHDRRGRAATRWHFADGGTDGLLDTFYLFYNPGPGGYET